MQQRRADERLDDAVDRLGRQVRQQDPLARVGQRIRRVHVHEAELAGRHRPERVELRPEVPERLEQRRGVSRIAEARRLDQDERPAAQVLGQERGVGQLQQAAERLARVRDRLDPAAPGVEDLGRALDRPEQRPGVELGDRDQVQLDRGHRGDVPAPAAQRPEQLGLGVAVDAQPPAVGRHDLGGGDAVAREPVRADHPAQAAPQGIAQDADVGRRAGEVREPMLGRGVGERLRQDARLDPRAAGAGVDGDPGHPLGLEEQRVGAPVDRPRVVAARVEGDPEAAFGGEPDGRRDVVGGRRVDDRHRPLVDREVPGLARRVPRRIPGQDDVAVDAITQVGEVHGPSRASGVGRVAASGRR